MKETGIVKQRKRYDLICCNPLTVAVNTKGKKRLCIDLSRNVNKLNEAPKFRIESTKEALQVIGPNDYMFCFDLKSAYFQIPMHEDYKKYFGFKVEGEEGNIEYFTYEMLPFGLNDAARCLTKVLRAPLHRWRKMGITVFIHIDDGFSMGNCKEQVIEDSKQVRDDLLKYGLLISEKKCSWGARQTLEWTGFVWNTTLFQLFVPECKLDRALEKVESLKKKEGRWLPVKELASLSGLLGSFGPAMGNIARFHTRAMLTQIAEVTEEKGWKSKLLLSSRVISELDFWKRNMLRLNGYRMRKKDQVMKVDHMLYSDAGKYQVGGAEFEEEQVVEDTKFKVNLSSLEQEESSTLRELRGIEEGLKVQGERLRGHSVGWGCDNWCATKIVHLGSMKPNCHEVAIRIQEIARHHEIELEVFWLRRDSVQITLCDKLSKDFDTSDYAIEMECFDWLEGKYGTFQVDYFASSANYRMKPFFSRFACSEATGVDAFTVRWNTGVGYFHPPVGLIVRVLRYAEECKSRGLLLVPDWPSSTWRPVVENHIKRGTVKIVDRFRPRLIAPNYIRNNMFRGVSKFDFLALMMIF